MWRTGVGSLWMRNVAIEKLTTRNGEVAMPMLIK